MLLNILDRYGLIYNVLITVFCAVLLLIDAFLLLKKRSANSGKIIMKIKPGKFCKFIGTFYTVCLLLYIIYFYSSGLYNSFRSIYHCFVTGNLIIVLFILIYIVQPRVITENGIAFTLFNNIRSTVSFEQITEWCSYDNYSFYVFKYKAKEKQKEIWFKVPKDKRLQFKEFLCTACNKRKC